MIENTFEFICDKCQGILIGCAIGDSIGIPFETMTYEEIKNIKEKDSKPYLCATDYWNSFYIKMMPENKKFGPGMHTDDTQLTSSLCRAFNRLNILSTFEDFMDNVVKEHVVELDKPPCSWNQNHITWGGTVSSIERLRLGTHYSESGNTNTVGNGVLMKSIPLGYFYAFASPKKMENFALSEKKRIQQVAIYSDMTHNTPQHRVSSNIFIEFLVTIFRNPEILDSVKTKRSLLESLIKKAEVLEDDIFKQDCDISKLRKVNEFDSKQKKKKAMKHNCKYLRLSSCLEDLKSHLSEKDENFHGLSDDTLIKVSHGGIYFNIFSLTMVIGLCLSTCNGIKGFDINLIKRSCFIGGDTDTNGAMIGAICGAMNGMKVFPKEYVEGLIHVKDFIKDSELFGKFMRKVMDLEK